MPGPLPPLVLQLQRYADESLPSLVVRLALHNAYEHPRLVLQLCFGGLKLLPSEQQLSTLRSAPALGRLAALLTRAVPDVLAATAHRFAPTLIPPAAAPILRRGEVAQPLLPSDVCDAQIRPERAAQFCPPCLAEQVYHRLIWLPLAVTVCLRHRPWLLTRCPQCHRPVSIHAVVVGRCLRCLTDLRQADAPAVPATQLPAQRMLQAWLLGTPIPMGLGDGPLTTEASAVLYHLVDGIATHFLQQRWMEVVRASTHPARYFAKQRRHELPPHVVADGYDRGITALQNWPSGLYDLLDGAPTLSPAVFGLDGTDLQEALYASWRGAARPRSAYPFVLRALEPYVLDRCAVPSVGLLAIRLAISQPLVLRLMQLALRDSVSRHASHENQLKQAVAAVIAQRRRWQMPLSPTIVARWLDLTPADVCELVSLGVLQSTPEAEARANGPWILPQAVDDWFMALQVRLLPLTDLRLPWRTPQPQDREVVDLASAGMFVAETGLTMAAMLKALTDGTFRGYQAADQLFLLHQIRLLRHDVATLVAVRDAGDRWIASTELARHVGSRSSLVGYGVHVGWLQPVAQFYTGASYFDRAMVASFLADHLTRVELLDEFGVPATRLRTWVRTGKLQPRPVPETVWPKVTVFRRHEVETMLRCNGAEYAGQGRLPR